MRVMVIGASNNRGKFGNKAVRAYERQDHEVIPINPNEREVEGLPSYASVLNVPGEIDRALFYVPPEIGMTVLEEIAQRGRINEIWLNPGAESGELIRRARELGFEPILACSIIDIGERPEWLTSPLLPLPSNSHGGMAMVAQQQLHRSAVNDPPHPLTSPLAFVGNKATSLRNRLVDQLWERRLGVNTRGKKLIHQPGCHLYGTFSYTWLMKMLGRLNWERHDVFVDIGCGKGRVLCCAAQFKPARVVGIDLDANLCEIARANVAHLAGAETAFEIVQAYAQEYDYSQCTKFFLFNPFNDKILNEVMASVRPTLVSNPRTIELVYLNPVHDDVFESLNGFERFDQWIASPWRGLKHNVSFWRAKARGTG